MPRCVCHLPFIEILRVAAVPPPPPHPPKPSENDTSSMRMMDFVGQEQQSMAALHIFKASFALVASRLELME